MNNNNKYNNNNTSGRTSTARRFFEDTNIDTNDEPQHYIDPRFRQDQVWEEVARQNRARQRQMHNQITYKLTLAELKTEWENLHPDKDNSDLTRDERHQWRRLNQEPKHLLDGVLSRLREANASLQRKNQFSYVSIKNHNYTKEDQLSLKERWEEFYTVNTNKKYAALSKEEQEQWNNLPLRTPLKTLYPAVLRRLEQAMSFPPVRRSSSHVTIGHRNLLIDTPPPKNRKSLLNHQRHRAHQKPIQYLVEQPLHDDLTKRLLLRDYYLTRSAPTYRDPNQTLSSEATTLEQKRRRRRKNNDNNLEWNVN